MLISDVKVPDDDANAMAGKRAQLRSEVGTKHLS